MNAGRRNGRIGKEVEGKRKIRKEKRNAGRRKGKIGKKVKKDR